MGVNVILKRSKNSANLEPIRVPALTLSVTNVSFGAFTIINSKDSFSMSKGSRNDDNNSGNKTLTFSFL